MIDADGKVLSRCVICGEQGHTSKDCKYPGGGLDPERERHQHEYKERQQQHGGDAGKGGKGGKGKKGDWSKGKGKDKGKGKGKDKSGKGPAGTGGAPDSTHQQPTTQWVPKPTAKAVTNGHSDKFPIGAAGLDSWANVWLQYRPTYDVGAKESLKL